MGEKLLGFYSHILETLNQKAPWTAKKQGFFLKRASNKLCFSLLCPDSQIVTIVGTPSQYLLI